MALKKKKSISIKKYKNKREMNLGIFLFAIVFLYLVITIISYFTSDTVSAYEVREGSIVRDNSYTGLVIRNETVVNAEEDGYVNFYQSENSKVKKGTRIYVLTPEELNTSDVSAGSSQTVINDETQSGIVLQVQNFNENYSNTDFSSVYLLKDEITASLQNELSQTRTEHLDAAVAESGQTAVTSSAARDGIVAYTIDGLEELTKDSFTEADFDRTDYESATVSDQMRISTGEPVYKLITDEDWSVIVRLEDDTARELMEKETTTLKVRIDKDSETLNAAFSVIERDGNYYGCLDFDNSMIRYAEDRYLNIELILEDETGLKIPKTAVVQEEFFVIPREYLTTGGNSSASGVLKMDENGNAVFQEVDIYNISEEEDEVYLSKEDVSAGDVLIRPESSDTYTVGDTKTLEGVYNINRGYAVFRKVTVLCENDDYCIVQEGEDYGLYNYDHIVQNGASVEPDEVVY
ncbi:MAG: HlyD family efflux transporter periplasmic adaptor subunit [Mediterraneibacter sp.]